MARTHKDVEFSVNTYGGGERIFKRFDEAAAFVTTMAITDGNWHNLDVLIYSKAGARFYGGDDAVESYLEDPEASVFERIRIKAQVEGRVP